MHELIINQLLINFETYITIQFLTPTYQCTYLPNHLSIYWYMYIIWDTDRIYRELLATVASGVRIENDTRGAAQPLTQAQPPTDDAVRGGGCSRRNSQAGTRHLRLLLLLLWLASSSSSSLRGMLCHRSSVQSLLTQLRVICITIFIPTRPYNHVLHSLLVLISPAIKYWLPQL